MFRIEVSKKNSRGKQLQLLSQYGHHDSRHVTYTLHRLTGRGGGKRVVGRIDEDDLGKVTGPKTPVDWSGVECCSSAAATHPPVLLEALNAFNLWRMLLCVDFQPNTKRRELR